METFVYALVNGPPFVQWRDVGASDVLYLAPWVLLIWLLLPNDGEAKSFRGSWRRILLWGVAVVAAAFIILVAYYAVSGA